MIVIHRIHMVWFKFSNYRITVNFNNHWTTNPFLGSIDFPTRCWTYSGLGMSRRHCPTQQKIIKISQTELMPIYLIYELDLWVSPLKYTFLPNPSFIQAMTTYLFTSPPELVCRNEYYVNNLVVQVVSFRQNLVRARTAHLDSLCQQIGPSLSIVIDRFYKFCVSIL